MSKLEGKRIAFLATDGFEQVELTKPWEAVADAGAEVVLVSTEDGEIQGVHHDEKGDMFEVDLTTAEAKAEDFDGLVLPGGVFNPDDYVRMKKQCSLCAISLNRKSRCRLFATARFC